MHDPKYQRTSDDSPRGAESLPANVGAHPARLPLASADPLAPRYERLKALFPTAVTDGRVDMEKLRAIIGEHVATGPERYGLSWAGKSDALKALRQLTTATLLPAPSESEKWETTGNAIIEGDNLEVLKVLQHAYHGKVKLIYIDPPYNTGGDFIYSDDYAEGLASYQLFTRQVNAEGHKLTTNVNTSGRYHSRWLTMIYPRLFLARNLLREDGVIFVSIDDNEVHNLRLVMDEIFGEENFVAALVWTQGRKSMSAQVAVNHEYCLVYCRTKVAAVEADKEVGGTWWRERKNGLEEIYAAFNSARATHGPDHEAVEQEMAEFFRGLSGGHPSAAHSHYDNVDARGLYFAGDISQGTGRGGRFDIPHPMTNRPCKVPTGGWRFGEDKLAQLLIEDRIHFGADETTVPCLKRYLRETEHEVAPSVFYRDGRGASKRLSTLFGEQVFDYPKDEQIVGRFLRYVSTDPSAGDIILDFFAGSGTTAHAVLELNREDGGNRKFILVQLPEPTDRKNLPTVAEITKERVRRVIQRMEKDITDELELGVNFTPPDRGFKVFRLAPSNFAVWDPAVASTDPGKLAEQWQLTADNVRSDVQEQALLYELMLKCGLPLASRVEPATAAGTSAYRLDEGRLVICLARELTRQVLRAIIELKPQAVLCLDVGFKGNDALKVNAQLEFRSHGIQFRTA